MCVVVRELGTISARQIDIQNILHKRYFAIKKC